MTSTGNNTYYSKDVTANMVKILCKQRRELKICHINAQSLFCKIDEFRHVFENSGLNIICISETWFSESITDTMASIQGYKLFRNDRKDGYGGVAIYVKRELACKIKSTNNKNSNDKVEHLILEACYDGRKFLIGTVYRPNSRIDLADFYKIMQGLTPLYNDVVIAGDFNSNLLSDYRIIDDMKSLGLYPTNTTVPTHFSSTNSTLLDLFFVSNKKSILIYDQLSASCFSRHDLIFLTYDILLQPSDNLIYYRNFKLFTQNALEEETNRVDWSCIYYMLTVNEQLAFLEYHVLNLFNKLVPLKKRNIKSSQKPWFTTQIKLSIEQRDIAYSRWKRYKTTELYNNYRIARKIANKTIRQAKASYYAEKFSNSASSGKTWKTIREIGVVRQKTIDNIQYSDPNLINKNFLNTPIPAANHFYYENYQDNIIPERQFSFDCVSQFDVLKSCLSIKSKAIGVDEIHPTFIKHILPYILPVITHIFNHIILTSTYPKRWKQAKVLPKPKSPSEYRPIAILPYLSKAFEKLLHVQITKYLTNNNLLTSKQSGFRAKNSCITALADVAEDLRKELDEGQMTMLVLLDHSKAFDTVDHIILLQKLEKMMHFSSTSSKLIQSYLSGREQCVEINLSLKSTFLPVTRGVPQGSILGPLLFSIYVNDLPNQLKHCNIRMFADDVQLYISNKNTNFVDQLNEDLKRVSLWASANGLSLNPKKSKCILLHKRTQHVVEIPKIYINNQQIEVVNKAKNLGVIFNSTLTWSDHVTNACGKTFSMLRTLWPTQYCTPLKIRMLLAKTYLIPTLTYACEIFSNCDAKSKSRLNVTYNNITRYVFGLKLYGNNEHISFYAKKLFGVHFNDLMQIRTLILLHKIITTKEPDHLYSRLRFGRYGRNKTLIQARHHTLVSNWQFFIVAIRLWNIIPPSIRETSNALLFRKRIFQYYS